MRWFLRAVPLSAVALLITIIVAVALSATLARRLAVHRAVAALLIFGFGLVLSATLTPTASALAGEASDGICSLSRADLPTLWELTRISAASLNVLLFVPLGIAVGLLPRTRAAAGVIVAAIALTFVVESVQLIAVSLGRGCHVEDLVTNLLGLAIGFAAGKLIAIMAATLLRPEG